ncbi:MAG: hypothetical protein Q7U54_04425 [Bacteroidales bacterium]|nr:hypothetical protein [Bacteroidales bacterium]
MKTFLENLNKYWATPIIAIVGGLLGLYFTVVKNNLEADASRIAASATKIETELKQREFNNNVKLQMYTEVKEAIIKEDKKLQTAVLLLVNEMLADDSLFREKLITILIASPNTDESVIKVQKDIETKTITFTKDEKQKQSSTFTIDVFYLEDIISESEPRAKKIYSSLKQEFPDYLVRMRRLPRSINAKNGYRISANEIRFEPGEQEVADKILSVIRTQRIFEKEQPRKMVVSPGNPSPNYLSIFVRNM